MRLFFPLLLIAVTPVSAQVLFPKRVPAGVIGRTPYLSTYKKIIGYLADGSKNRNARAIQLRRHRLLLAEINTELVARG